MSPGNAARLGRLVTFDTLCFADFGIEGESHYSNIIVALAA